MLGQFQTCSLSKAAFSAVAGNCIADLLGTGEPDAYGAWVVG